METETRQWPTDPNAAQLARYWNRASVGQIDRYRAADRRRTIWHMIRQNIKDLARRGKSNRAGGNNRRWRRYLAERPRVIFDGGFYCITE